MSKLITLYHGSVDEFDAIDLSYGKPFKDFGRGFYTSRIKKHAEILARRNRGIEISRQKQQEHKRVVKSLLYRYEFDMEHLKQLSVKQFDNPTVEWMRFVVENRTHRQQYHHYDIVIGPTANDNTRTSIQLFFSGAYGDIHTDTAVEMLIKMLEPERLPAQFFFGSQKATKLLIFREKTVIK